MAVVNEPSVLGPLKFFSIIHEVKCIIFCILSYSTVPYFLRLRVGGQLPGFHHNIFGNKVKSIIIRNNNYEISFQL